MPTRESLVAKTPDCNSFEQQVERLKTNQACFRYVYISALIDRPANRRWRIFHLPMCDPKSSALWAPKEQLVIGTASQLRASTPPTSNSTAKTLHSEVPNGPRIGKQIRLEQIRRLIQMHEAPKSLLVSDLPMTSSLRRAARSVACHGSHPLLSLWTGA